LRQARLNDAVWQAGWIKYRKTIDITHFQENNIFFRIVVIILSKQFIKFCAFEMIFAENLLTLKKTQNATL